MLPNGVTSLVPHFLVLVAGIERWGDRGMCHRASNTSTKHGGKAFPLLLRELCRQQFPFPVMFRIGLP